MAWIAREDRRSAAEITVKTNPGAADCLPRSQAAGRNRRLYETCCEVQAVLGSPFLLFVLFAGHEGRLTLLLGLLMLALVMRPVIRGGTAESTQLHGTLAVDAARKCPKFAWGGLRQIRCDWVCHIILRLHAKLGGVANRVCVGLLG